ncbi:winged helix DNA-binding domain-containing protein [Galbitalea sp. SE-J8]|uniref:winged helix DNA-binding domain-containing protein n=1 Tax=Galbitalea sp. SE-J8 TaxID=3054952 RepID=UPI00259D03A9|nr:winged helix DNA-binding domain-containing protein [Galbitalea sp. SE-J8]MDM4761785.1 winged helix DNA-binding domain-containing protein [Galbitalea sp. SE-J8]
MTRAFTPDRRRLTGLRLAAQRIVARDAGSPAAAVRHLLAAQAQDLAGALWSIGLRTRDARVADVRSALDTGLVVRSWPMRGTLHLTTPADLHLLLSVTAERGMAASAKRRRDLGIDDDDLAAARRIAEATLADGPRPRADLLAAWQAGGQSTAAQRGAHLIVHLAQSRVIVLGPTDGTGQAFALVDAWAPAPHPVGREEALAAIALRYALGHGPATDRDLAWWAGITLTDARAGLAAAGDALERVEVRGVGYWQRPGLEAAPASVVALPGFDEYLLGYQDRSAALHLDHADRVVPGGNGMFLPTIVVDGEVLGTWKRTTGARGIRVALTPFASIPRSAGPRIARAVRAYGEFVGSAATVVERVPA